jgi:hypothetical protein
MEHDCHLETGPNGARALRHWQPRLHMASANGTPSCEHAIIRKSLSRAGPLVTGVPVTSFNRALGGR